MENTKFQVSIFATIGTRDIQVMQTADMSG